MSPNSKVEKSPTLSQSLIFQIRKQGLEIHVILPQIIHITNLKASDRI